MPLSSEEMRLALARGLGRALLHARAHGVERDRELLLATCLRNPAHDPQSEVDRADWMVEFLDAELASDFLAGMDSPERASQAYYQARLAFLLARRGHSGAAEALYAKFSPGEYGADLFGAQEILELDGEQGLRTLLRRLRDFGEPERIPDWVETLEGYFESSHGKGSAYDFIKAEFPYLSVVDEGVPEVGRGVWGRDRRLPSLDEILRSIDDGASCGIELNYLGTLVDRPTAEAVLLRFSGVLAVDQLARLLQFFACAGFPELQADLVRFADHPSSKVRWWAIQALSKHKHSMVRELALRCLRKGRWRAGEAGLLEKNFEIGDETLLRSLLRGQDDHRLISRLTDLCRTHRAELLEVMIYVYEFSTCLFCRGTVIKVMRELDLFPEWAAEEHRYDALTFSSWN